MTVKENRIKLTFKYSAVIAWSLLSSFTQLLSSMSKLIHLVCRLKLLPRFICFSQLECHLIKVNAVWPRSAVITFIAERFHITGWWYLWGPLQHLMHLSYEADIAGVFFSNIIITKYYLLGSITSYYMVTYFIKGSIYEVIREIGRLNLTYSDCLGDKM